MSHYDELDKQLQDVLDVFREKKINVHEAMRLINSIYADFLDFHPEEKEKLRNEIYHDT